MEGQGDTVLAIDVGTQSVRAIVFDRDGNAKRDLVRAVVSLSDAMGFTVVAEGVETTEQGQSLTELGVDLVQGYLLARPMPRTLCVLKPFCPSVIRNAALLRMPLLL